MPIQSRAEAGRVLRVLLGEELGIRPQEVELTEDGNGKPRLAADSGRRDLRFNVSHSGKLGLIAIAEGVELGVDLEAVTHRRPRDYLRDWTRREAYVKGTGAGLRGGPRRLDFEPDGAGRWRVLDAGELAERWLVLDLDVGAGYVGALAADSEVDVSVSFDLALPKGP